jgi:integrase
MQGVRAAVGDLVELELAVVTFHTLRHSALSRMIAAGHSDYTVKAISSPSNTRMLERDTHRRHPFPRPTILRNC